MKTTRHLQVNDRIAGFEVTRIVPVEELNAELVQMEHLQTGLRLVWLRRDEENQTFAITFETLPWNDTGVFHILEHSVLCGSDRYPVKEPFVELLKNSMNTFLNALTFSDKTMYPVSSKNDKDFMNLMSVYLDAVFHPAIYHKPEIFHQEGWHYEKDGEGKYSYKGVVFNEMKGAFADSEELLENAINRALFPDTPYAYCSGGDPASIPDLTYDDFLDAHRKFYAPSNGIIYLDGDIDIDEVLSLIDRDFLADAKRSERIAPPVIQKPVDGGVQTIRYELSPDENADDKYIIGLASVLGTFEEREKQIAMLILTDVLAGNNESYITKLILEKGLAQDVSFQLYDGLSQPWVRLEVKNCRKEDIPAIKELVFSEIKRLCDEGIDHERIEAVMANNEFLMNERDFGSYPQGLFLGFQVMESMLYGGKPEQNLEIGHHFRKLEAELDNGYFENLLREVMLDNSHKCEVILEPSKSLGEERRTAEELSIHERQLNWSEGEIKAIEGYQRSLEEWQSSEDSEAALATLPHLELKDIDDKPEDISCEVKSFDLNSNSYIDSDASECADDGACDYANSVKVLRHNIETGEIRHIALYFDVYDCDEEELSALSFMNALLGDIETMNASADEILLKTQRLTGRLNTKIDVNSIKESKDISSIQFGISFSALEHNLMKASELVADILLNTSFDNADMILDILKQTRQELMQSIIMGGHAAANMRVGAMYSAVGAAKEAVSGYECYKWLKKLENEWDAAALSARFSEMLNKLIRSDRMTVSITAGASFDETDLVKYFAEAFSQNSEAGADTNIAQKRFNCIVAHGKAREGIVIPADISFAVRGGDIGVCVDEHSSGLRLALRIISLAYLWNEVRVKGGAYGTGMRIDRTGLLSCYSYRDPNGAKSLETYTKTAEFLRMFAENTSTDLTGFIVGAVSDSSPLMTARVKGVVADGLYFAGISYEERCEGRKNLLAMTKEKLASYTDSIEKTMADGGICIVGSEEQIKQVGDVTLLEL